MNQFFLDKFLDKFLEYHQFYPVITIGDHALTKINRNKKNGQYTLPIIEGLSSRKIDARFRFLDASIWHYYLSISEDNFEVKLKQLLQQIQVQKPIYQTNIAHEFIEFKGRLLKQSYLSDKYGLGGHARKIVPFKFHSESNMRRELQGLKEKLSSISEYCTETFIWTETFMRKLSWNVLLVDDYATTPLNTISNTTDKQELTKKRLITKVLSQDWAVSSEQSSNTAAGINIHLTCASSITEAKAKLKDKKVIYDIILLDYLIHHDQRVEYGTDLLLDIRKHSDKYQIEPLGHFWIFPITAFPYAMLDELSEVGISRFNRFWFLADGGDPVNMPELFRYKFLNFVYAQVQKAGREEMALLIKKSQQTEETEVCLFTYMNALFGKGDVGKVKEHAMQSYRYFIKLYGKYSRLFKIKGKSPFAETIIKVLYRNVCEYFWEHWLHLLFLLGNGSKFQAAKMWAEYTLVRRRLLFIDDRETPLWEPALNNIKKYIVKLGN